jgi:hypothetical protein
VTTRCRLQFGCIRALLRLIFVCFNSTKFDFYIIPLAKKLKDCGVFGVSTDEYLNYALQNRANWVAKGPEIVAAMIEKYREDAVTPKVQLDHIQDSDGGALRSNLLSNDTEHNSSSHVIRAVHENLDLDMEAMSVGSMAVSTTKSLDGRSFASSTETIFEDSEEWNLGSDGEEVEKDDFYSSSESGDDDGDENKSLDDEVVVSPQKTTKTGSNDLVAPAKSPSTFLDHVAAHDSSAWGQDSGDSFFYDAEPAEDSGLGNKPKSSIPKNISTANPKKPPAGERRTGRRPTTPAVDTKKIRTEESSTSCSTTQVNTEWEQSTVGITPFRDSQDAMDNMEIYCLQQRIQNRLVGSIKNTRAYDKKPSEDEMIFF